MNAPFSPLGTMLGLQVSFLTGQLQQAAYSPDLQTLWQKIQKASLHWRTMKGHTTP